MDDAPRYSPFDLLPPPLIALILSYLGTEEKLLVAPRVCQAWRTLCISEPLVWRIIDLGDWEHDMHHARIDYVLPRLALVAGKELRKLDLEYIVYDELGPIVSRCQGSLEWLRLGHCDMTDEWAKEHAPMLSNLKHLELLTCFDITRVGVAAFGQNCPCLTHLSIDPYDRGHYYVDSNYQIIEEEEPSAMKTQLKELVLILTILQNFRKLESLIFLGKWIELDLKRLSNSDVRARLLHDIRKKYNYFQQSWCKK